MFLYKSACPLHQVVSSSGQRGRGKEWDELSLSGQKSNESYNYSMSVYALLCIWLDLLVNSTCNARAYNSIILCEQRTVTSNECLKLLPVNNNY